MLPCAIAAVLVGTATAKGSVRYNAETHVATQSAGCGKSSPYQAGKTSVATTTVAGVKWTYRIYVPKNYDPNHAYPIIFQQPGWGMTAKSEESGCGITSYAEAGQFISVTVQGDDDNTHRGGPWYSWNAVGTTLSPGPQGATCTNKGSYASYCYTSCSAANKCPKPLQCSWTTCHDTGPTASGTGTDISGFVPSLYDTLESQLCIDTTREYNAGESNGGMMCYQTGVVLHERLAAIVPQFGSFHRGFAMAPTTGVAILSFHGSRDTTVPANTSLSGDGYYYTPTADIFANWKKSNQCSGGMSVYHTKYDGVDKLWCEGYQSCSAGDVVRCSWNGGHNWFGNSASKNGGLVTDFLLKWTKPSHIGMGATKGQEVPAGNILNVTILTQEEEDAMDKADKEATLDTDQELTTPEHGRQGHYGNPYARNGCRSDEEAIEVGTGMACAFKVSSKMPTNETAESLPVPTCDLGHLNSKNSGCPTDARVRRSSKAWPVCLAKGSSPTPYEDGDFHCLLSCPCLGDGTDKCGKKSDAHCPRGATCERGELRHMAHGVCTYHKK